MQAVLSDDGEAYVSKIENLNLNWLAILNTHLSKFGNKLIDPLQYASPSEWYNGIDQNTPEYTIRQNRAKDLNQADVINNPFGKEDRYGVEFVKSDNFPDSEDKIRGQVACALAYRSNALFWWLWDEGNSLNERWGWYTIYHYTPTKDSQKKILSEMKYTEHILNAEKVIDTQVSRDGVFYRYIKDVQDRELIIAFNETEADISLRLTLLSSAGTVYTNLIDKKLIDLSTQNLEIAGNGGVFLINDPNLTIGINNIGINTLELEQNTPNPFSSETNIKYHIQNNSMLEMYVLDIMGKRVCSLVNSVQNSGSHNITWDRNDTNGARLPAGTYFCILNTNNSIKRIKMILK